MARLRWKRRPISLINAARRFASGVGGITAASECTFHRCRDEPRQWRAHGCIAKFSRPGVLVVLNDEIQAAREVTKTSTYRLQTFRSPDFGVLGHADCDAVTYYRQPVRRRMPDTEFDIRSLDALPRVDIAYTYTGSDDTAVRAFIEAGAQGIVSAGFAPGFCGPGDLEPLQEAVSQGIIVVQSTRAGSGRTFKSTRIAKHGFLIADNLNPQKARLLLTLALTVTRDPEAIARIFATY